MLPSICTGMGQLHFKTRQQTVKFSWPASFGDALFALKQHQGDLLSENLTLNRQPLKHPTPIKTIFKKSYDENSFSSYYSLQTMVDHEVKRII